MVELFARIWRFFTRWHRREKPRDEGARAVRNAPSIVELFGRCPRGHRARLVWYDEQSARHQEPYVQMFTASNANVYRIVCPVCGEEYTTFDTGVERLAS